MARLYDQVKELLEKYPSMRDSDRILVWNVWGFQGYVKSGSISRSDFFKAANTESIRRVRQKIQEKFPALRSSKEVQKMKDEKEKEKGTFVYREDL